MHATSLQGFDYGGVVHQFEKRCNPHSAFPACSTKRYMNHHQNLRKRIK
ncbi:MAG: hypothetical protein O4965_18840 [Trichodesmium sp. St19_bin1]|nr:hypothetical protein [Trichodesmium sp. St19_bin1]